MGYLHVEKDRVITMTAETRKVGRPISAPCGTVSAYKRHTRNNDIPCQQCKEAWAAYQRQRYHTLRAQ